MEQIFTHIYEKRVWGDNGNPGYNGSSGTGSSIEYNHEYIKFLIQFIRTNNIKKVTDIGCGDFRCGPSIYDTLNIEYTGYDAYRKIIEYNSSQHLSPKYTFIHLDACNNKEMIQGGELCILKDIIQHWSVNNIYSFLDYLVSSKKFKFILIINCCQQRIDNPIGNDGEYIELNCNFLPLKKYNPKRLFNYANKEISIIEVV